MRVYHLAQYEQSHTVNVTLVMYQFQSAVLIISILLKNMPFIQNFPSSLPLLFYSDKWLGKIIYVRPTELINIFSILAINKADFIKNNVCTNK